MNLVYNIDFSIILISTSWSSKCFLPFCFFFLTKILYEVFSVCANRVTALELIIVVKLTGGPR